MDFLFLFFGRNIVICIKDPKELGTVGCKQSGTNCTWKDPTKEQEL